MPRAKLESEGSSRIAFQCPGCRETHTITVGGSGRWTWNGDFERPTFQPSVLVTTGHFASGENPADCHICQYRDSETGEPWPWPCGRCHSFVTNGRIQFLGDCTHALAGQTVDLPEITAEA